VPESGLDCLICALTVLYVPESSLDSLMCALTVLYVPESGLDCLICAIPADDTTLGRGTDPGRLPELPPGPSLLLSSLDLSDAQSL